MARIALATAPPYDTWDEDLPPLRHELTTRGHAVEMPYWDGHVDWAAFDLVVVRSCWDYPHRREEFLAWARTVPRLLNTADVIAWNTDKTYLRALAAAGVPVIPTLWDIADGDDLGDAAEWVVKPSISAGSRDTARWSDPADVYRHSAELTAAGRVSMTQPYVPSVDGEGETALLYFGGRFSHAIRKGPLLHRGEGVRQDRDSREDISRRTATAVQREVGDATLAAVRSVLGGDPGLLYARVDLVTGEDGQPQLMELELVEPSVFLPWSDDSAARFADAIEAAGIS